MDQFDPEKKIGLIVDEWGDWFDVEPVSYTHLNVYKRQV